MGFSDRVFVFVEEYSLYILLGLTAIALCLIFWNLVHARRLGRMGKTIKNLMSADGIEPKTYQECLAVLRQLHFEIGVIQEQYRNLESTQQLAVQKIGLVRFNAFEDVGGEQSFALALLDCQKNGLVLSSIFGRAESRIYAKAISDGRSERTLSTEEQEALKRALT